jgi:hypothetical protein
MPPAPRRERTRYRSPNTFPASTRAAPPPPPEAGAGVAGAATVERSEVAWTISLDPQRAHGFPGSAFSKPQESQVRMDGAGPP